MKLLALTPRVVALGLACAAVSFSAAQALAAGAQLVTAQGEVWVTPPEGKEVKAAKGSQLEAGTRIRTGNGEAELKFENGSVLKVRANSSMSLSGNKRTAEGKSSVVLFFGRLWSKITKGGEGTYEVSTANAVCGVRGTEFETAVADDGSVKVVVDEGHVAVTDESKEYDVEKGEQIDGDEGGLDADQKAEKQAKWEAWEKEKKERLKKDGKVLVDSVQSKIMTRKGKIEDLLAQQKELEKARKEAQQKAQRGDRKAASEVERLTEELGKLADAIARLGDQTTSQFGLVDHYADLANDPRFGMIDRKYLVSQAESLRRIKANLDKMVADGTDISMEAMDQMMDDMGTGKGGGLKDKGGSSKEDVFGDDPF